MNEKWLDVDQSNAWVTTGACLECGFIVSIDTRTGKKCDPCACNIREDHPDPKCKFRLAATCRVPIECDHGYDVCPKCDPCTCSKEAANG